MNTKRKVKRIFKSLKEKGVIDFISIILFDLFIKLKYGVGGTTVIPLSTFKFSTSNKSSGKPYQSTHFYYFFLAIKHLPYNYNQMRFIDLGSGKGDAILMAVNFDFHKIIGIEFVPELCQVCRKNIQNKLSEEQQQKITILNKDVVEYTFKDLPTIIFLFNPFDEKILRIVLENINKSIDKSDVIIIYINPVHINLLYQFNYKKVYAHNSKRKLELAILTKK